MAEHYRTPLIFTALECSLLPNEIFRQLQLTDSVEQCISRGFARTPATDPGFVLDEFAGLARLTETFCTAVAGWQQQMPNLLACSVRGQQSQPAEPLIAHLSEFVELRLYVCDARGWSPSNSPTVAGASRPSFDAVYFDPFSPESNPELWTAEVFEVAASGLRPGGLLTSYCVKSSVRKALQQCGLQVRKMAGPVGGKREVLVAQRV